MKKSFRTTSEAFLSNTGFDIEEPQAVTAAEPEEVPESVRKANGKAAGEIAEPQEEPEKAPENARKMDKKAKKTAKTEKKTSGKPKREKQQERKEPEEGQEPQGFEIPAGYILAREKKTKRVQLLLRPGTEKLLRQAAEEEQISLNELANRIFDEYLQAKRFYTTTEAARALGVTRATIAGWIRTGKIEAVKAGGWRIPAEELERIRKR